MYAQSRAENPILVSTLSPLSPRDHRRPGSLHTGISPAAGDRLIEAERKPLTYDLTPDAGCAADRLPRKLIACEQGGAMDAGARIVDLRNYLR